MPIVSIAQRFRCAILRCTHLQSMNAGGFVYIEGVGLTHIIHDDVYTRARASDDGLINNINSITHASPSSRYFIVMLHSGYTVSQNVHFSFF